MFAKLLEVRSRVQTPEEFYSISYMLVDPFRFSIFLRVSFMIYIPFFKEFFHFSLFSNVFAAVHTASKLKENISATSVAVLPFQSGFVSVCPLSLS